MQKIGLETHVQLKTKSKLFCSCSTANAKENENTCPICLGFPGTRPLLNKKAVELAVQIALAMKCKIADKAVFSRKSYLYPDLAKNYQITQYDNPIGEKGVFNGINITRVHLEEDPGKITHVGGNPMTAKYVTVDYNRSGIALCEIVTEPDFKNPQQARIYLEKLFDLLAYLDLIDPNQDGVMRSDCNASVDGGERVEIKNVTGFAAAEKALKSELNQQILARQNGKKVISQTKIYSQETGTTIPLRKKEGESDYGYIYEPDLTPISLRQIAEEEKNKMKKPPEEYAAELAVKHNIPKEFSETIVFNRLGKAFEAACEKTDATLAAKWLSGDVIKCMNYTKNRLPGPYLVELIEKIGKKEISERLAKEVIKRMFAENKNAGQVLGEMHGQENKNDAIAQVIQANAKAAEDYRKGNKKAIEFLVGEVMKKTKAGIGVKEAREKLEEELKKPPVQ